jgi:predicted AAA+ superfamily ATPase
MLHRSLNPTLQHRLRTMPAVALTGPRQCGKTTLAQSLDGHYFDLEQDSERLRLDLSWDRLVAGDTLIVLDEAQTWPPLFPRLRGSIDGDRKRNGRFLLLGSVSPALMREVSESLAGRLSLLELSPLLLGELVDPSCISRHWLMGGFPDGGVLTPPTFGVWQRDYLSLLTQRDLPEWGLPAKPRTTDRLLRMLAALHAQPWNASQVGASLGLSYHTVNSYLDFLEGAFLVRRLPAFQRNLRKRLIKRPKVFIRDSGLLHALLMTRDADHLLSQPWVGASWEGYVIDQAMGLLHALGAQFEAWWFRTSDGKELDLVLELPGELWAIEVKLTASPGPQDLARLDKTADLVEANRRFLVSKTVESMGDGRRESTNIEGLLAAIREKFSG